MDDGEQVMSEVHVGCPLENASCRSLFTIASSPISDKHKTLSAKNTNPFNAANEYSVHDQPSDLIDGHVFVDENGDLVMPRRKLRRVHDVETHKDIISIHHRLKTSIPYVGLQIWRGSLLLGDFLLHKMQTTNELDNVVGLELGAGTGLVGILMAMKARLMFLTDYLIDILDNCHRNVLLNSHRSKANLGTLRIRWLDWQEPWPPSFTRICGEASTNNHSLHYSWHESDLEELKETSIILASDVIYSDSITDAFFSLLEKLMPSGSNKVLWLALEKRYNFSLSDLDVVAHGYQHFRSFLDDRTQGSQPALRIEDCNLQGCKNFSGKQLQLDQIPQYILEYERTSDLELWQIWRK